MNQVLVGRTYRHYKNKLYRVIALAKHSEDLSDVVVYEALYENATSRFWARPMSLFAGTHQLPDGTVV